MRAHVPFIASLLILTSCQAVGQGNVMTASPAMTEKKLTFFTEEWKPFNFINDKGDVDGFTTAIVKKIGERLETNTEITLVPWSRALSTVQQTKNSVLYSVYRAPEREHLFKWVGPIYQVETVLWGLKDKKLVIRTLDDAKKYKIAVQADSAYLLALERKAFDPKKLIVNALRTDIEMVVQGGADLVPLSLFSIGKLNERARKIRPTEPPQWMPYTKLFVDNIYLGFNNDTPDSVIMAWQQELNALKGTAFYKQLETAYILPISADAKNMSPRQESNL